MDDSQKMMMSSQDSGSFSQSMLSDYAPSQSFFPVDRRNLNPPRGFQNGFQRHRSTSGVASYPTPRNNGQIFAHITNSIVELKSDLAESTNVFREGIEKSTDYLYSHIAEKGEEIKGLNGLADQNQEILKELNQNVKILVQGKDKMQETLENILNIIKEELVPQKNKINDLEDKVKLLERMKNDKQGDSPLRKKFVSSVSSRYRGKSILDS